MISLRKPAAALALVAMSALMAAQAHAMTCVPAEQFDALVRFGLPDATDGLIDACHASLGPDAFLNQGGHALVDRYRTQQTAAWPLTRQAIRHVSASPGGFGKFDKVLAQLPDDALRPFVQGMVKQLVAGAIKPADCPKIDRVIGLLAPLPPENVAGLATTLVQMVKNKSKPGQSDDSPICPGTTITLPAPGQSPDKSGQ